VDVIPRLVLWEVTLKKSIFEAVLTWMLVVAGLLFVGSLGLYLGMQK
jgi:hypothetical protein